MHPPLMTVPPLASRVQAAFQGLGNLFALVVIDPLPIWSTPPTGRTLPERNREGHDLLALRWHGPPDIDGEVLAALDSAADRAPSPPVSAAELAHYQDSLPDHLHLVALPASSVLGPWSHNPHR
ncbi:hypothetical protein [Streptomyces sp. NBC_00582]|uniref:hypothetical protein n=1 Tax=Streptomyces sp. NBC_00582 TaxID=2975783 RepID=UPI002E821EA0|nr:hypothetical protein [Streptomyces sp. NBC_00582]WUB68359.1 hypothetical protein OG852_49505 [Streptomyces sp. NBC_00582]